MSKLISKTERTSPLKSQQCSLFQHIIFSDREQLIKGYLQMKSFSDRMEKNSTYIDSYVIRKTSKLLMQQIRNDN